MILRTDSDHEAAILGAMRRVATGGVISSMSEIDRGLLVAAHHVLFGQTEALDVDALPDPTPADLAHELHGSELASDVAKCCVVAALTDGVIDPDRLNLAHAYADALGVHAGFVAETAALAHNEVQWVIADMQRRNIDSITNSGVDVNPEAWIHPYRDAPDPELNARYRSLADCEPGTLGHAFFHWYDDHGFAFSGDPDALADAFSRPHDTTHILSGYSTTQQGELLVSTFTAAIHPRDSMAAHIMPVILSWHVGIALNTVAGASHRALDPEKFFVAWDRAQHATIDPFAPDWDFWAHVDTPVHALQAAGNVAPLDPKDAASAPDDEGYVAIA